MDSRTLRRNFAVGLLTGLRVVWPILSVLFTLIVGLELLASGSSRGRAMIWSLIALAFGVAIASAKWFIGK